MRRRQRRPPRRLASVGEWDESTARRRRAPEHRIENAASAPRGPGCSCQRVRCDGSCWKLCLPSRSGRVRFRPDQRYVCTGVREPFHAVGWCPAGFVVLSFLLGAMPPEHALAAGEQAPTPTPPPTVGSNCIPPVHPQGWICFISRFELTRSHCLIPKVRGERCALLVCWSCCS